MKRNMDLIREILLLVEREGKASEGLSLSIASLSNDYTAHVFLLVQAGFLDDSDSCIGEHRIKLTWSGYEYLDSIRDEKTWEKVKRQIAQSGGGMALELIKSLAIAIAKAEISRNTGLQI